MAVTDYERHVNRVAVACLRALDLPMVAEDVQTLEKMLKGNNMLPRVEMAELYIEEPQLLVDVAVEQQSADRIRAKAMQQLATHLASSPAVNFQEVPGPQPGVVRFRARIEVIVPKDAKI